MNLPISLWGKNWLKEVAWGLALSALMIGINYLFPSFVIGFPFSRYQGFGEDFLAVSILAPVFEEIFFRFTWVTVSFWYGMPILLTYAVGMGMFAIFHYAAYGESLSAQSGSFVGAALFAAVAIYVTIKRKNVLPSMIMHFSFNTWLLARLYGVI